MNGTAELAMWVGLMLLGFAGSALFSGMETGCYCLNRVRLHVKATHGVSSARSLEKMINRPTTLLSTLLIGNNITNYLGTAGLAVILNASGLNESQQLVLNTLIVIPVLFVFGETLPKDLFSIHADALMYRLQPVLKGARWLFTLSLLVPIVGAFSWVMMKLMRQAEAGAMYHPRRRVGELVKEGVGTGLLSDAQSAMIESVLATTGAKLASHMTPWARVQRIQADDGLPAIRRLADQGAAAHLPVTDEADGVVGVLDVLQALASGEGDTYRARDGMQEALTLRADLPLRRALAEMRRQDVEWAVVTDAQGRPIGVVTPHDVLRPITGALPR